MKLVLQVTPHSIHSLDHWPLMWIPFRVICSACGYPLSQYPYTVCRIRAAYTLRLSSFDRNVITQIDVVGVDLRTLGGGGHKRHLIQYCIVMISHLPIVIVMGRLWDAIPRMAPNPKY